MKCPVCKKDITPQKVTHNGWTSFVVGLHVARNGKVCSGAGRPGK